MNSGENLLRRHLPILRFHSEELYSVVGVEAMTDFYFTDGPGAHRWTRLKRIGENSAIAEARADAGVLLNSSFLATNYGPDWPASDDDFLDTANLSYAVDAAIAQENPAHANVIYGSVAERADGEPGKWLQYWFFFTYNSKAALRSRVGVHEGDWEMIQVRLDGQDQPEAVTYAQHRSGQCAPWPHSEDDTDAVEVIDDRPVVYVALGSHASYLRPGHHRLHDLELLAWLIDDVCDAGGRKLNDANLRVLDRQDPPAWVEWPGRWGASIDGKFQSPRGPGGGGSASGKSVKWDDPDGFHAGVAAFKDRSLLAEMESGEELTEPDVAVTREGNRVTVTYNAPSADEGLWSAELLIMTHQGDERAPVERVYLVNGADDGLDAERPEPTPTP